MFKVLVFDAKQYDKDYFARYNKNDQLVFDYEEKKLTKDTVNKTEGYNAVCIFTNDDVNSDVLVELKNNGVKLILNRCAGFNQVDINKADELDITILRVPAYSPHAVAEMAVSLLLTLNRKIHLSLNRISNQDFTLSGLNGFDIYKKKVGVIGTGKIGKIFAEIMKGFNTEVLVYDVYQDEEWAKENNFKYVSLEELLKESDFVSLHCPLFDSTKYMINKDTLKLMKPTALLVNSSRGPLINTKDLIDALDNKLLSGVGLDVYENENAYFFEDFSDKKIEDEVLLNLINRDDVIMTSHQAFFTEEALFEIYNTTIKNAEAFMNNEDLVNIVKP